MAHCIVAIVLADLLPQKKLLRQAAKHTIPSFIDYLLSYWLFLASAKQKLGPDMLEPLFKEPSNPADFFSCIQERYEGQRGQGDMTMNDNQTTSKSNSPSCSGYCHSASAINIPCPQSTNIALQDIAQQSRHIRWHC